MGFLLIIVFVIIIVEKYKEHEAAEYAKQQMRKRYPNDPKYRD